MRKPFAGYTIAIYIQTCHRGFINAQTCLAYEFMFRPTTEFTSIAMTLPHTMQPNKENCHDVFFSKIQA